MLDTTIIKEINNKYANDAVRERLCIASVICERMKEFANEVVMVGGSAVEFYTAASYMTKDIDFIAKDAFNIKRVMTGLGFKNDGDGIWYHDDTSVIIEFPKGPLVGEYSRTTRVETAYGIVEVIGIEDIILDRVSAAKFWQDTPEWAEYLLSSHYDNVDFTYLRDKAKELLCTDTLELVIKNVNEFKNEQGIRLNDEYSQEELIDIIKKLLVDGNDVEQVLRILSMNNKVPGTTPSERGELIRNLLETDVVKKIVKDLD